MKRIRDEKQNMIEHFWRKWNHEYLATLLPRKKWFQMNAMKICHLHGGYLVEITSADKLIRAVEIQTGKTKLIRPVQKICLLPTQVM